MSFQRNQRYAMPMPQYPPQPAYPSSYGQPQQYPPQSVPYPSQPASSSRPPPYPSAASVASTNPPYPSVNSTPPYPNNIPQSQAAPYTQTSSYPQSQVGAEVDTWVDSAIKTLIAIFKDARKEELEDIVTNENKLIDFVQSADEVKKLKEKREELIQSSKDQAVTNLSLEPELDVLKTSIVQLAQEQNELKEKYSQMQQRIAGNVSLDQMCAVLQVETAKSESASDKISHDFLDSNSGDDIDQFLEKYIATRTTYQLRKVKSDKMTQLIAGDIVSTGANNSRPSIPMPTQRPNRGNYGGYSGY